VPKNPLSSILDDPLVEGSKALASRLGRYVGSGDAFRDSAKLAVRVAPDMIAGGLPRVLQNQVAKPMADSLVADFKDNPGRTLAENTPIIGDIMSVRDAADMRNKALEARARGDMEGYRRYSELAAMVAGTTLAGMIPIPAAKAAKAGTKSAIKAAERDAVRGMAGMVEKYGLEVPKIKVDNPGGDWLAGKVSNIREDAAKREQNGYAPGAPAGPVTGYMGGKQAMLVDPAKLKGVPGAMRESPAPGQAKYDALAESIGRSGYDAEQGGPLLIGVNHAGEPYIMEGNNRAAVARDLGIPAIPAEVRYFAGG